MRRPLLLTALVAGSLVAGVSPALAAPPAPAGAPAVAATPAKAAPTAVPARYLAQRIAWQPCFPDGPPEGFPAGSERLECGSYSAPRDWANPGAKIDVSIAVSRLRPATGRAGASLLSNPGGPGGPGRTLPLVFLFAERTRVLDSREIVGIDVRGTGDSTNVTCGGGTGIGAGLDPRDRSRGNTELILDSAELTAKFCQTKGGELSPFINTKQTVADLDLLRALLRRTTIDWLGYSGGTWLGAAYATYFPSRVGRFVLDGNTEFTTTWQRSFAWQPRGFERRFRVDYLPWVARYDELFGLGRTAEAARRQYESLRARLAAAPLELDGLIEINGTDLDNLIAGSLYSKTLFQSLTEDWLELRELVRQRDAGAATAGTTAARQRLAASVTAARQARVAPLPTALDSFSATFNHILCNDTPWRGDRASLLRESAEQGRRYPLRGWYTLSEPCVFWDRPEAETLAPRTGRGVPPVLMVQNDKDPATPIEGAVRARRDFAGARMITVVDEGDHTIYPGNPCVDAKVEAFLLDGAPARDAQCRGLGLPVPTAPETRAAASTATANPLVTVRKWAEQAGPMPK